MEKKLLIGIVVGVVITGSIIAYLAYDTQSVTYQNEIIPNMPITSAQHMMLQFRQTGHYLSMSPFGIESNNFQVMIGNPSNQTFQDCTLIFVKNNMAENSTLNSYTYIPPYFVEGVNVTNRTFNEGDQLIFECKQPFYDYASRSFPKI